MALKALNTLNVRRTEKFPRLTNSVTYLREKQKTEPSYILFEKAAEYSAENTHQRLQRMTTKTPCDRYLRHDNDAEIQPVPGIFQKRELP